VQKFKETEAEIKWQSWGKRLQTLSRYICPQPSQILAYKRRKRLCKSLLLIRSSDAPRTDRQTDKQTDRRKCDLNTDVVSMQRRVCRKLYS